MPVYSFFAPLLHANTWTWDEMLMFITGLVLIVLLGYFGQHSEPDTAADDQLDPLNSNSSRPRQALSIRDVSHRYGKGWALSRLWLDVPAGQRLSIFGPNGAGKSTLLNVLATLTMPTAGDVVIGDQSLKTNPTLLRQRVGFVAHKPMLYPHLTVWENLSFFGRLYNIAGWPQRAEQLLKQVRLWSKRSEPVRSLSQGQKQRVAIARAMLHDPDILLLDEPYAGLDVRAAEQLDQLLDTLKTGGRTLLITSHDLARGYQQSDQLVILADGRLVYQAAREETTLDALQSTYERVLSHYGEYSEERF